MNAPLLIVVCGLSATGKSTLARELERVAGASVLSSDSVRKQLAGVAEQQSAAQEHYGPEFNRRTYEELGRLAAERLQGDGGAVVVDATFRNRSDREAFRDALGEELSRELRMVECVAPDEVRAERSGGRKEDDDASDATPEVAAAQEFEPLSEVGAERHLCVRTDRELDQVVAEVKEWLGVPA